MLKRIVIIGLLLAPICTWAIYKPVRVLVPELNDVSCISDEICLENIEKTREANTLYRNALSFVNTAIGKISTNPRTIFCSSDECLESFGFHSPAKAKTIGIFGIVVGPRGWSELYIRHEMIHHLQSEQLGILTQWQSPRWFKEGMAYSLSEDQRKLSEPWASYRIEFERWYRGMDKELLWIEAKKL